MITRTRGCTRVRPVMFRHPLTDSTKVFAVEDAAVFAMLTDTGAAPTYDVLVDVTGIKSVRITPQFNTKELRGDNVQLEQDSTLISAEIQVENAKLSFPSLPVLFGGNVVDTGVSPAEVKEFHFAKDNGTLPYFKFAARTPSGGIDSPGGDLHFTLNKCKVTAMALGLAEEDYQIGSFTAIAVFPAATLSRLMSITMNETPAAIA